MFTVRPGRTATVAVRLSKAKLKALRKKKQLALTATAVARDTLGARKTTTGRLTVLAPR